MAKGNLKFMGVDLISTMGRIVYKHTEHYKSDFEYDKNDLMCAVNKAEIQDRTFLWLCRDTGTWLLRERDVFLKETSQHHTFTYYSDSNSKILAYAVVVNGMDGNKLMGDIYDLDYAKHCKHVISDSLYAEKLLMFYENGTMTCPPNSSPIPLPPDAGCGTFLDYEYQPKYLEELDLLLWKEQKNRERFSVGDLDSYLAKL